MSATALAHTTLQQPQFIKRRSSSAACRRVAIALPNIIVPILLLHTQFQLHAIVFQPAFMFGLHSCRRLAALHALSGRPAGQQQQQQQKSVEQLWAELPQQQRLHAMAPHGRAPATFLAAAGAFAAEVTQAVQVCSMWLAAGACLGSRHCAASACMLAAFSVAEPTQAHSSVFIVSLHAIMNKNHSTRLLTDLAV